MNGAETRTERIDPAHIDTSFNDKQRLFLNFVLQHYVDFFRDFFMNHALLSRRALTKDARGGLAMSSDPKPEQEGQLPKVAEKPLPLWAALAIALCLIVLPAVIVGPLFAPFIILWAGCALALSFKSKFAQVRKQRLRNLAIYLFASIMTIAWHSKRIDQAQAKGDALIAAIKTFRAENRRYPANLDELVPKHIDTIPIAAFGRYFYHLSAENNAEPSFFFVTLPPFGRRAYCFEDVVPCTNLSVVPVAKNAWFNFD